MDRQCAEINRQRLEVKALYQARPSKPFKTGNESIVSLDQIFINAKLRQAVYLNSIPDDNIRRPFFEPTMPKIESNAFTGIMFVMIANLLWGFFPLYFAAIDTIDVWMMIGYRMILAFPFVLLLVLIQGRLLTSLRAIRKLGHHWPIFFISTLMMASSWSLYLWAVQNNYVTESAMGYYLTPLMTVFFGSIIFHEKLTRNQWIAVAIASASVLNFILSFNIIPWVGITLGLQFAIYSTFRKFTSVGALDGMLLETALIFPLGLLLIFYLHQPNSPWLGTTLIDNILLLGSGAFTVIPILFYVAATRLLTLTTVGLLFYIAPSTGFLLGIFYFNEPFSQAHLIMFAGVWLALIIYSVDSLRLARKLSVS
jgi:chloramphenicol-sensitive protein RarD